MSELTAEKFFEKEDVFNNDDYDNSVVEEWMFSQTDMIKFAEAYFNARMQANDDTTGEKQCNLPVVNNLAKLAEFVRKQKDLPPEINDIVNDNFWDLI
jgi:hypothetical protein